MFKLHHYMIYLVYAPRIFRDRPNSIFNASIKVHCFLLEFGRLLKVNVFREITFHHLEHMPFRVSHSTTFSRISLTKMYFFSTTPLGYDKRYIQFFQNCITLQIFLEKCETLINKVLRSLKKISSHHLDQKLKLQGVQDQNLLKEKAITLKRSISDPTLVKTKCVSGQNNFFTSTSYLFTRKI